MKQENRILIQSANELAKLGKELERAKSYLKTLVQKGLPYTATEIKLAYENCLELGARWELAEHRHKQLLATRQKIASK